MKLKDFKKHPLYWKYNDVWYVHKEWMAYFHQTLGLPPQIYLQKIKEKILHEIHS